MRSTRNGSFLGDLRRKMARRIRDQSNLMASAVDLHRYQQGPPPDVEQQHWWEEYAYGLSAAITDSLINTLDAYGIDDSLALITPGLPEARQFQTRGFVTIPSSLGVGLDPGRVRLTYTAPKNQTLVLSQMAIDFLGSGDVVQVSSKIQRSGGGFDPIVDVSLGGGLGPATGADNLSTFHKRAVLYDEDRITYEFTTPVPTAPTAIEIDACGWIV